MRSREGPVQLYQVTFNAFKRIAAPYSEAEKTALFSKTATEFYRLKLGC